MSSGFPQRANLNESITKTILSRAGNNTLMSERVPWIRVTSCLHEFLTLESTPMTDSFGERYGSSGKSGKIGVNKDGDAVYADELNDADGNLIGSDRSFRPSPTIESVAVTQGNEGLSKKTNFTLKCFTMAQAEALLQYFLEPATNILVEWGFNENDSVLQKTPITPCDIADYHNIKHLTDKRKKSKGTYDATFGIVTGGSMGFGDAETYEIQVEITSMGEMPAYLQHHKNTRTGTEGLNDTGKEFDVADINDDADDENSVGKALFKQMFNDLPAHKRIDSIKNLVNQPWATNEGNFVNMDKEIRTDLIEATKKGELHSNKKGKNQTGTDAQGNAITEDIELSIPTDTPLFDTDRYIRAALAFTILDLTHTLEFQAKRVGCKKITTQNPYINWRRTICRAHKNIFSTRGDKLMIPNKNAPSFDFTSAFSTTKPPGDTIQTNEAGGIIPQGDRGTVPEGLDDENNGNFLFPQHSDIDYDGQAFFDSDYVKTCYKAHQWGYLKDLFINFDFFIDCIKSPGLLSKDVYYKILNGLSSGVNMYWDFQIVERGKELPDDKDEKDPCLKWWRKTLESECRNGDNELQIVCFHSTGNTTNKLGQAKFQSRGLNSPFLSAELNMDIPSAMKGQLVMQKGSEKDSTPNPEQTDKDFQGLFTKYKDSVNEKLNPLRKADSTAEEAQRKEEEDAAQAKAFEEMNGSEKKAFKQKQKDTKKKNLEDQKKSNYEAFGNVATIVPRIQYRKASLDVKATFFDNPNNNVNIEDLMMVVAYDDESTLKSVQEYNIGKGSKGEFIEKEDKENNAIPLPIKFNFTVHGISGIRVGDTFNIKDLPGIYKKKIFQVTQVEHNIEQSIWKTSVQSMFVQIPASDNTYSI